MHPLRILILFILFYILFRLLAGAGKKRVKPSSRAADAKISRHDVLVEDPVCHTYIPKGQAIVLDRDGTSYYFCSEKCRETFLADKGDST